MSSRSAARGEVDEFVELSEIEGSRLRFLPQGGVVSYLAGMVHASPWVNKDKVWSCESLLPLLTSEFGSVRLFSIRHEQLGRRSIQEAQDLRRVLVSLLRLAIPWSRLHMAVTCSWLLVCIAVAAANSSLHHLTCRILTLGTS